MHRTLIALLITAAAAAVPHRSPGLALREPTPSRTTPGGDIGVDARRALAPISPRRVSHSEVRHQPRRGPQGGLHRQRHADDPRHGLALPEPEDHRLQPQQAADPRLREARQDVAARRVRVGVPTKPAKAPLPGATYGSFAAACHYADGTFVPAPPRPTARRRAPRAEPRSVSGTPTSSRSTSGPGTRTRTGSTRA